MVGADARVCVAWLWGGVALWEKSGCEDTVDADLSVGGLGCVWARIFVLWKWQVLRLETRVRNPRYLPFGCTERVWVRCGKDRGVETGSDVNIILCGDGAGASVKAELWLKLVIS